MVDKDFADKTLIVTGAGGGIGAEISRLAAARGAHVVAADIAESAHDTVASITNDGGKADVFIGDLSEQDTAEKLIAQAASVGGELLLANNAGVMDKFVGAADLDNDTWQRTLSINLDAPFFLTRAALKVMRGNGSGAIVNTGSAASIRGAAAGVAYTVSKHALLGLTKNTAYTYARENIRCNMVCPGGVETGMTTQESMAGIEPELGMAAQAPIHSGSIRIAQPEEVAQVIIFLLSDAASDVNGTVIPVDAGWAAG